MRGAIMEGSLANGSKTTPSLRDSSDRIGKHAMLEDGFKTMSLMEGSLHQEIIKDQLKRKHH
jgi:hypothetical protein